MKPLDCHREAEVIDAIASRRWPDRIDDELRTHVAHCAICADVAVVASAIRSDQDGVDEAAQLPPAELVWFRAQARARAAAARQAARPIAVMQAVGLAAATALISTLIGVVAYWVWQRADWLASLPTFDPMGIDAMGFAVRGVLLAIGLWLILAPVAVYLVASDD
jgi:hypothetical protein